MVNEAKNGRANQTLVRQRAGERAIRPYASGIVTVSLIE
jgi:hypothetical protein